MINLKYIAILPFTFIFLPAMSFSICQKHFYLFFIFNIIFFISLLINFQKVSKYIFDLYNKSAFKYFTYLAIWILTSGFLLITLGKYRLNNYIYYMTMYLGINILMTLLLPCFLLKYCISLKKFIKIYTTACVIIFLIGFLDFIGKTLGIAFLTILIKILANTRFSAGMDISMLGERVQSVFEEPGWFAGFITINLPIFYSLAKTKYKIFKNPFINFGIKKSLIIMAWLNLLFTKSPIWLIFAFIVTGLYYRKIIIKNLYHQKYLVLSTILIILGFGAFFLKSVNIEETYLSRILNTVKSILMSYDTFAMVEPSMASRVTSYVNSTRLWLDNPILGIGLGNAKTVMAKYFETSPIALTVENTINLNAAYIKKRLAFNSSFLFEYLSETGIIGCALFYLFLFKLIKMLTKNSQYFTGIIYDFVYGLRGSIITLLMFSFYDISSIFIYAWFIIGIAVFITYIGQLRYGYLKQKKELNV